MPGPRALVLLAVWLVACHRNAGDAAPAERVLTISAFSVVREAYDKALLPAFSTWYEQRSGQPVRVEASYGASGAQSRAVVEGFEADVVVFSMADDVERLRRAGLVTHDYEAAPYHGLVSHSIVAFAVRPGNPKAIHDWADLTRSDVEVLTANPNTSGGAIWNIAALYGAAQRQPAREAFGADDPSDALARVLRRVEIMDRSGRDSVQTFERGMGDVVLTYENEIIVGQRAGRRYERCRRCQRGRNSQRAGGCTARPHDDPDCAPGRHLAPRRSRAAARRRPHRGFGKPRRVTRSERCLPQDLSLCP